VQYQTPAPHLPRWRLRRWVLRALIAVCAQDASLRGLQLTLRLVDAEEARALNHGYRGRGYATNVLTFEYGQDPEGVRHADVALCLPVLMREAREQGKPELHHAAHLVVHGVLHALGFDHVKKKQAQEMETLETRVLAAMGIAGPYG
jgi:probable rRNA maturation factor